jgi:hypothetical protein
MKIERDGWAAESARNDLRYPWQRQQWLIQVNYLADRWHWPYDAKSSRPAPMNHEPTTETLERAIFEIKDTRERQLRGEPISAPPHTPRCKSSDRLPRVRKRVARTPDEPKGRSTADRNDETYVCVTGDWCGVRASTIVDGVFRVCPLCGARVRRV